MWMVWIARWCCRAALLCCLQAGALAAAISAETEKLALAEDWSKLAKAIGDVDLEQTAPEVCLLKAHACLAVNRNNEAICIFTKVCSAEALAKWVQWTQDLAARNPQSVAAHYLYGDAQARGESWDGAVRSFSRALELSPGHMLTLNARACASAMRSSFDTARDDLTAATEREASLAEIYVTRGVFILQRRTDPDKAIAFFDKAIQLSPDHILALNGRACARIVKGDWEAAADDLEKASKFARGCLADLRPIIQLNAACLIDERTRAEDAALEAVAGIKPGTSLEERQRLFNAMSPSQRQTAINLVNNAAQWNQRLLGSTLLPDKASIQVEFGVKKGLLGPQPSVALKFTLEKNYAQSTAFNYKQQNQTLDRLGKNFPNMRPQPISNVSAFFQQLNPQYSKFTKPGGVSTTEIGAKQPEKGDWKVWAKYTLNYDIEQPKEKRGRGQEKPDASSK